MLRKTAVTTDALRRELGYVDEKAVAGLLGVTVPRFRVRQSTGTAPPHYKVGREKLYKLAEVEAWIARQRVARAVA